ncbi:MAG: DNA mismatch repair endonuclease MutL [Clostridiales bacterium]|nr:DNA mismatch repair endonuclease MutL [Clostridiales bacterium]
MAVIQRLSQHVADLIAAGEVVERPASCVKELVENAIDAGAKTVTVELQNGGMTLLRVTDDGCGMDSSDARTAFLRHATSKLHTKEDLTAIRTLGFRGEALAAISAVSRIDLLTRTAQAQTGTALHLEAGVVTDEQPAGCPVGTTILVRDLFYNTPARLKFMKSDLAESSAALTVAQHLALANPGVSLRVVKDGAEALHTAGSGVLFDAVYAVLGRQLAGEMVKVDGKFEKIETSGFATRPACTRGNRQQQLFFVNGRFVKSRLLMSALEQAYQNQMTVGRFPSCVLHIQLPPQAVDVNVHPAKTEVKFLREREVFDAVHYAVLSALGRASGRQELKLPQQKPAQAPAAQAKPQQDFFKTMDAAQYRAQAEKTAKPVFTAREREWTKTVCEAARIPAADVPKAPEAPRAEQTHTVAEPVKHPEQEAPKIAEVPPVEPVQQTLPIADAPWRVIGEALDTYILVQQGEKLLFIDKHAAHERILFEKLKKEPQPVMAQRLLAPIPAELGREEAACVLENAALFTRLGFGAEEFGDGTLLLREIPESIRAEDAAQTVQELAGALLGGNFPDAGAQRDALLHTVACKAAIKAGYHTDPREREYLVREVLTRDDLKYCPHGRPICIELTKGQLERQFKR